MDSITLHLWLSLFLIAAVYETQFKRKSLTIQKVRAVTQTLTLKQILPFLSGSLISLALVILSSESLLQAYMMGVLTYAIFFHVAWLTLKKPIVHQWLIVIVSVVLVSLRVSFPHPFIHNLFMIAASVWLGSFISSFKYISQRVFIYLSVLWVAYDIFYVWLTPAGQVVSETTDQIMFPLGIMTHYETLGLADLFFVTLCLSILKQRQTQSLAALLFLMSSILLTIFAYWTNSITTFPLLVIWAPIGIAFILRERIGKKDKCLKEK